MEAEGISTSFVYWADLFYDNPTDTSSYESVENELENSVPKEVILAESEWLTSFGEKLGIEKEDPLDFEPEESPDSTYERIFLPFGLKKRLLRQFLKEAHDYLFNTNGVRDVILDRVIEDLNQHSSNTKHIIVGHSQGSFIAYDVLTRRQDVKDIAGLLTLGSPLGIDEVQEQLVWTKENGFPGKLKGDWVNVYDPFDPVARIDPVLKDDYQKNGVSVVNDINEANWGTWRHSATKYFKGKLLRGHLRQFCERTL